MRTILVGTICHFEAKPRNPSLGKISHGVYPEYIRRVRDASVRLPRRHVSFFLSGCRHRTSTIELGSSSFALRSCSATSSRMELIELNDGVSEGSKSSAKSL